MRLNLIFLFLLLYFTFSRRHLWTGLAVRNVSNIEAHDVIEVRTTITQAIGALVLPCSIAIVGDPIYASTLVVDTLRFGRPQDAGTVHCDVQLVNLTLVLQHVSPLLDTSALHYYRLRWHNVTIVGTARLEADGGELFATALLLPGGGSMLDVRGLSIVHVHDSIIQGSEMHFHQVNVLSLTGNHFTTSALSLTHVEEDDRIVPRIVDVFDNVVHQSVLLLECTQADVKTSFGSDGIAAFDTLPRSTVSPTCRIDYAAPAAGMYANVASLFESRS